jgi:hypothetical protein
MSNTLSKLQQSYVPAPGCASPAPRHPAAARCLFNFHRVPALAKWANYVHHSATHSHNRFAKWNTLGL